MTENNKDLKVQSFKRVVKLNKSPKLYDRVRDRKSKDLYNYDEKELSCDSDEKE